MQIPSSGQQAGQQNIKTYEQKIIWTNEFSNEPQIIEHMNNIHRQNIVAICLTDESTKPMLIIMNINSQINNYEHLNKKEREKDRIHYLKFLEEGQKVERLRLLAEGSLVAVGIQTHPNKPNSEGNKQDESNLRNDKNDIQFSNSGNSSLRRRVVIMSSVSGEVLYHSEHLNGPNPCIIQPLQLNRISYSCLITSVDSGMIKDHGFTAKKFYFNTNSKSSLASQKSHYDISSLYKVTLLASSELSESIKNDFLLELKENQLIIEARFYQNHKKTIGVFLLSSGFVLMYMVNERGLHDCVRVDSRISKAQHQRRMNTEKDKAFFRTQKSESDEQDQPNITIEKKQSNANKSMKNSSKLNKNDQNRADNITDDKSSYYFPSCFCFTSCKIVLGYEDCSFIGIISYSAVDHRQHKFWYVFDFFFEKTYVQSIRKICFSEDGCHCSVLVKVRKEEVKPGKSKKNSVRIWSKWNAKEGHKNQTKDADKNQDKKNLTGTDNSQNSYGASEQASLSPQKNYPPSFGTRPSQRQKKHAHISPKSSFFKPSLQSLMNTSPNVGDEQWEEQRPHYSILHIDFVSGLIEHEYHNESIEESLTTMGLKGRVEQAEFNSMNNSLLVLMSDSRLFYYSLNMSNICSEKDLLLNSGKTHKGSITSLRKKLESASFFSQKSVSNYLSPEQILLWTQKLKVLPHKLLLHPLIFELVIIYGDNIKFHFYNFDKMFECHYVMALKNCKAASYSPNGDKLLVGTLGSVWLVDSYTHAVVKKVQLVVLPNQVKGSLNTSLPPRARRPNRGNTIKDPTPSNKSNSNNNDTSNNDSKNGSKTNENGYVTNPVGPPSSIRRSQSVFVSLSSKTVSHIQFLTAFDLIIQTGNTTLSTLTNYDKIFYYGATSEPIPSKLFCYDYKHRLGVVATETHLKIITKASINSKNKCEELAKVQLQISAIKLCADIDVLFLGSEQGILYFLRWPEFFIGDTVKNPSSYGNSNKLQLFHCAVQKIQISMNYRQLFVVSRQGEVIICELTHSDQVQKIGKEVSYRMSKKLDLQLPLLNKWLISTLDEEKRAQNITKLMGNEAEIKNNEIVLAQDYKALLQRQSSQSKTALQVQLKQEIKKYEIDSGIQKLQMDIAFVRDQIRRISGKREEQSKRRNEQIQKELHDVFVEREKLEKELKEVEAKVQKGREGYRQEMQHDEKQYCQIANMQVQEKDKLLTHSKFMFDKKFKIDMAMSQHLKEDFLDEVFQLQKSFTQQLQHLYQENNSLVSQNRNLKVESVELTQKMREMQARMLQVEGDCQQLQIQKDRVGQVRKELQARIQETDKKYHGLIKKTKQLEINLNQIRTSSEACQLKFNDLQTQLQILQQKNFSLQTHHQQAELDFIQQSKLRNMNTAQQDELKHKILELKSKRKKVFEYNVLLKDLIKPYEKNSHQRKEFNGQKLQSEDIQNFERVFEWKRQKTDKLTSDVQKWKLVKDDNKIKFIKYNQKLQEQNNKLVFRFNELQKQAKQLKKLENHLKKQVQIEKMKQHKLLLGSTEGQKNSFLPKANESFYNQKKASLSFKREGLHKQKLPSGSYHLSSSQSLQRQSNLLQQKAAFSLNKNNTRNLIKQLICKQQSTPIAKKSLLSSLTKHRESQTDCKQNRGNYHGVFLDRQTLKPKKTLCLSLHSDGDMAKFVTES